MTQKWNLQDIRPSTPRKPRSSGPSLQIERNNTTEMRVPTRKKREPEEDYQDADLVEVIDGNKSNFKKKVILSVSAVCLFVVLFFLSNQLSKTTLSVYPLQYEPVVNAEFSVYAEKRPDALPYEILTITEEGMESVKASGEEYAEVKAVGVIDITKNTAGAEQLVKNTRFRTTEGKIFRIDEPVLIPGAVKNAAGELIPGKIQAKVTASEAGAEFNVTAGTKFDVPGFEESGLTESYKAVSATNPSDISGGFKGQKLIINDAELSVAKQSLEEKMRNTLLDKVKLQIPAGFVYFGEAVALTYEEMPSTAGADGQAFLQKKAILQVPIFKNEELASFLAEQTVPTYEGESVRVEDSSKLQFTYLDPELSRTNLANLSEIKFKLSGKPRIIANYDAEKFKADLAGKSKTALSTVLTGYKGIEKAEISGKPFWSLSFPDNVNKIEVLEVLDEKK